MNPKAGSAPGQGEDAIGVASGRTPQLRKLLPMAGCGSESSSTQQATSLLVALG